MIGCLATDKSFSVIDVHRGFVPTYVRKRKSSFSRRDDVASLIAAFEAASYFTLHDSYQTQRDGCPEVWTDNPTAITSIRINGKTKTVAHYYGCQTGRGTAIYPNGLTYLETQIDHIVATDKWIK